MICDEIQLIIGKGWKFASLQMSILKSVNNILIGIFRLNFYTLKVHTFARFLRVDK
jgi:hypothetical protein